MKTSYENDNEANRWNHRPNGPVTLNPLFDWPPRFFAVFRWYSAYWLAASTTTLACVLAVIAYFTILPSLELMQKPQLDWIIRVWLANLIPHVTCAGLLHLWLYKFKGQDEDFKFDPRQPSTNNGTFSFRNQVMMSYNFVQWCYTMVGDAMYSLLGELKDKKLQTSYFQIISFGF